MKEMKRKMRKMRMLGKKKQQRDVDGVIADQTHH
jgi:hypothetical protein